jgi:hypothetical protein
MIPERIELLIGPRGEGGGEQKDSGRCSAIGFSANADDGTEIRKISAAREDYPAAAGFAATIAHRKHMAMRVSTMTGAAKKYRYESKANTR